MKPLIKEYHLNRYALNKCALEENIARSFKILYPATFENILSIKSQKDEKLSYRTHFIKIGTKMIDTSIAKLQYR